jgi:hypothetical protein
MAREDCIARTIPERCRKPPGEELIPIEMGDLKSHAVDAGDRNIVKTHR